MAVAALYSGKSSALLIKRLAQEPWGFWVTKDPTDFWVIGQLEHRWTLSNSSGWPISWGVYLAGNSGLSWDWLEREGEHYWKLREVNHVSQFRVSNPATCPVYRRFGWCCLSPRPTVTLGRCGESYRWLVCEGTTLTDCLSLCALLHVGWTPTSDVQNSVLPLFKVCSVSRDETWGKLML